MVRIRQSLLKSGRLVLSRHGMVTRADYHVVRPNGTADWLLIHCVSGGGKVQTLNGEAYIGPGTCVLFPEGCPQDYRIVEGQSCWEIQWAHFLPRDGWDPARHGRSRGSCVRTAAVVSG